MSAKEGEMAYRHEADDHADPTHPPVPDCSTASGAWHVGLGLAQGQISHVAEAFGDARSLTASAYAPDTKTRATD